MKLRAIVEYDKETDSWSAYCPELPGLASCGFTKEEALKNFHEAAELFFEPDNVPVPQEVQVVQIVI